MKRFLLFNVSTGSRLVGEDLRRLLGISQDLPSNQEYLLPSRVFFLEVYNDDEPAKIPGPAYNLVCGQGSDRKVIDRGRLSPKDVRVGENFTTYRGWSAIVSHWDFSCAEVLN